MSVQKKIFFTHRHSLELRGEDLYLNQKRIRFHRKFRSLRTRLVPVPVKRRKTESRKGEWKEQWDGMHICSYPPEDIVVVYIPNRPVFTIELTKDSGVSCP